MCNHVFLIHSALVIPAWRSKRTSRSWLISLCGFGIVRVIEPLVIYGCLPSWYGPLQPNFLIRATKTRRETGPSLGIYPLWFRFGGHFKMRDGQAISEAIDEPPLQRRNQICATFFECMAGRPDPSQSLNLCVKTLSIVYHFVLGLRYRCIDKILNHFCTISH